MKKRENEFISPDPAFISSSADGTALREPQGPATFHFRRKALFSRNPRLKSRAKKKNELVSELSRSEDHDK
jgi:hypothetical protein